MFEIIIDVLLALFNSTTSILTAQFFFSIFSKQRNNTIVKSLIAFLTFLIFPLLVNNSLINMIVLSICCLLISFNYYFSIWNKIIFTCVFVTLNVLIETIFVIVLSYLFKVNAETITSGIYAIFGSLISKLIFVMFCYIIGAFKNKAIIGKFKINWIAIVFLPVATLLVTYSLHTSAFYYEDDYFLSTISVLGLTLLIISNLLIIRLINEIHEFTLKEVRLSTAEELVKQQEKQYCDLLENNNTIIKLRHDYKNFLVGILSMLSNNEKNKNIKLRDALENKLKIIDIASNKNICGNSVIDTIINYKMKEAEAKGICIDFKYKNANKIDLLGVDLAILLGNALDNAIEATECLKNASEKQIEIDIGCLNENVIISIINNVRENVNVEKLHSEKGDMHGYGIINMRAVASKYNGLITFSCEDRKFTTFIILNYKCRPALDNQRLSQND